MNQLKPSSCDLPYAMMELYILPELPSNDLFIIKDFNKTIRCLCLKILKKRITQNEETGLFNKQKYQVLKNTYENEANHSLAESATRYDDAIFLNRLLQSPNITPRMDSLLALASACGKVNVMTLLLSDKRTDSSKLDRPLALAKANRHFEIVDILILIKKYSQELETSQRN